jgi:uncharacterized SAM-binding protein YcdF (DUF218 family)
MIFALSKLAFWIFMPISWMLGLLLWAFFCKKDKRKKRILLAAIVLLTLLSNPYLSRKALHKYEYPITSADALVTRPLAVVLTGVTMQVKSDDNRVFFSKGADRVSHAVYLYKTKKIQKILVSGGSGALIPNKEMPSEAETLKKAMMQMGVPEKDILVEVKSRNTYENALFSKPIIKQMSLGKPPILITSAFHLPRALGCFKKVGVKVDALGVDYYATDKNFSVVDLVPSEQSFASWGLLIHELIGRLSYKVMGRI